MSRPALVTVIGTHFDTGGGFVTFDFPPRKCFALILGSAKGAQYTKAAELLMEHDAKPSYKYSVYMPNTYLLSEVRENLAHSPKLYDFRLEYKAGASTRMYSERLLCGRMYKPDKGYPARTVADVGMAKGLALNAIERWARLPGSVSRLSSENVGFDLSVGDTAGIALAGTVLRHERVKAPT